ncbi:MAG TPA: alpha-N-acetylglucosaminidase TIM-barrel domain-containing protein [Chitinophagaceae bacterium]|nr:alpha-N-acetylglucosaminidase TIM-barrel domain-containing protein [Chitinophagaceae bacterium]
MPFCNENALFALIRRLTPAYSHAFEAVFLPDKPLENDGGYFEIDVSAEGKIMLCGYHLRDLTAAYGWYLKHVAQVHLSWAGDRMDLPRRPPLPKEKIIRSSPWEYRYAYNYCALSYTMAFNDWSRWEREIDFLALNGFTHVLVTAGLEKVWQRTLTETGYPAEKITSFIANPVYAAWWHMGNLEGLGGPLTQGLIDREAEMGLNIVRRLRELAMEPVLQGFVGLVPHDVKDYFPSLPVFPQGEWLNEFRRPALLDPLSPGFERWAEIWYRHLHEVYDGGSLAYGGDLFHEGGDYDEIDLCGIAGRIQKAMQQASPGSYWVLQGWRANPLPELVHGLDKNHALILELWKNMSEGQMKSDTLRTYEGCPWAWCEVTNFGGNHDLYGGLSLISELPSWLLHHPNRDQVCGLGLLSEGLETNPIQYDLFLDVFQTDENIDLRQWLDQYVVRRYGKPDSQVRKALDLLAYSVYDARRQQEGSTESILCAQPSLDVAKVTTWASDQIYYHPRHVIQAANHLLKASPEITASATYRYDLVDVVRQVMADLARPILAEIHNAFREKDVATFNEYADFFLGLFDDTEKLLASDGHWLLGTWLESAKAKGNTPAEKALMERAARRMVTSWSGTIDLLNEYSNRQWAGLIKDYYKPRWSLFFTVCGEMLQKRSTLSALEQDYIDDLRQMDFAFEARRDTYAIHPRGDTVAIAEELFEKYAPKARGLWEKHHELVSIG